MGYHTTKDVIEHCPPSVQESKFQLLLTLAAFVDDETRAWWIHMPRLAEKAHMAYSTACLAMNDLLDRGFIIRNRESRKDPYTYRIVEFDKIGEQPSTTFIVDDQLEKDKEAAMELARCTIAATEKREREAQQKTALGVKPLQETPPGRRHRSSYGSAECEFCGARVYPGKPELCPKRHPENTINAGAMDRHEFRKSSNACDKCGLSYWEWANTGDPARYKNYAVMPCAQEVAIGKVSDTEGLEASA